MFLKRWLKQPPTSTFAIGESVVVKAGVKEVETSVEMSGWQGRITEVDDDHNILTVEWDSITLRALPPTYIEQSEENGYSWDQYFLSPTDVTPTTARDTEADVAAALVELERLYTWVALGPEGKAIQAVLKDVDPADTVAAINTWEKHLQAVLRFPFKAVIAEFQEHGRLQAGDQVQVRKLAESNERYGLLVEIQSQHGIALFPLCDLEAANHKSPNYEHVQNYAVWYANR